MGVKIDGVLHEFSVVPGVTEDVTELILNLKQLNVRLLSDGPETLVLDAQTEGEVGGKDPLVLGEDARSELGVREVQGVGLQVLLDEGQDAPGPQPLARVPHEELDLRRGEVGHHYGGKDEIEGDRVGEGEPLALTQVPSSKGRTVSGAGPFGQPTGGRDHRLALVHGPHPGSRLEGEDATSQRSRAAAELEDAACGSQQRFDEGPEHLLARRLDASSLHATDRQLRLARVIETVILEDPVARPALTHRC